MANPNDHSFSWRKMLAMLQTASWDVDRMALPDLDSSVGHSFGLEFDGVVIKQITEVSGLRIDQDVVEFKQDTDSGKRSVNSTRSLGQIRGLSGHAADTDCAAW